MSQIKRAQLPQLEECCWQGAQFVVTQVQMGQIGKAPQLCRNTVEVIVVYLSAITMYIWSSPTQLCIYCHCNLIMTQHISYFKIILRRVIICSLIWKIENWTSLQATWTTVHPQNTKYEEYIQFYRGFSFRLIGTVKHKVLILMQGSTNFPKIYKQPPNSRHHKGYIKWVP